jgi:hypothetical protein
MKMARKKKIKTVVLPKTISILGRIFTINEVEKVFVKGVEASGSCCAENRIIEIEKGQSLSQKMGILGHEVGHAGLVIFGLDQKLTDGENEIFCQLLRALIEDYISAFKK